MITRKLRLSVCLTFDSRLPFSRLEVRGSPDESKLFPLFFSSSSVSALQFNSIEDRPATNKTAEILESARSLEGTATGRHLRRLEHQNQCGLLYLCCTIRMTTTQGRNMSLPSTISVHPKRQNNNGSHPALYRCGRRGREA